MTPPPALPLPTRARPSPNHDARPPGLPVDMLVLHYTGMRSTSEALDRLCDPRAKVSSHYLVEEDGLVWQLVDEQRRAYHAGVSYWRGHTALNDRSIGVEIANPGHAHGYRDFPLLQLAAVCDLSLSILARNPIPDRHVVAHSDIAPDRKEDPGERFDWRGLAENGVGLWPHAVPAFAPGAPADDAAACDPVRAALAAIGYRVAREGGHDDPLACVLRAFQRHWRPEAVTGRADPGTVGRLRAVARLCRQPAHAQPRSRTIDATENPAQ